MPIHLTAPAHTRPSDGKGWNRFSTGAHMGTPLDQCALQPTTPATWMESQDTRRAHWGLFQPCFTDGACATCPILAAPRTTLRVPETRLLARLHPHDGHVYLTTDPALGWAGGALRYSWIELARLSGWTYAGGYSDEHGEGFWIRRLPDDE